MTGYRGRWTVDWRWGTRVCWMVRVRCVGFVCGGVVMPGWVAVEGGGSRFTTPRGNGRLLGHGSWRTSGRTLVWGTLRVVLSQWGWVRTVTRIYVLQERTLCLEVSALFAEMTDSGVRGRGWGWRDHAMMGEKAETTLDDGFVVAIGWGACRRIRLHGVGCRLSTVASGLG